MKVFGRRFRQGLLAPTRAVIGTVALYGLTLAMIALVTGCDSKSNAMPRAKTKQSGAQGGLFESVVDNLDRMERFDTAQIFSQICDRLNQWYLQEKPQFHWQVDPLVADLPDDIKNLAAVKLLDSTQYRLPDDGWCLQEAVWLRDISTAARADQFEDLAVAERLFDWTVRNIQLEPDADSDSAIRYRPFETLLRGRGTAAERAWLFILLARQQGLDVVMLALTDDAGKNERLWLPALLSGGELYLFDARLGLPIPGPEGRGVATLSQAADNDQLLRRLDLDEAHPYPVRAADLKHVVALVEASPASLSRRMGLVESRLAGKQKMGLASPGSALAERVKKVPHIAQARLWTLPFEVALWQSKQGEKSAATNREMLLFREIPTQAHGRAGEPLVDSKGQPIFFPQPTLMTARKLHFKGQYDGDEGAKFYYLRVRPTDTSIEAFKLPPDVVQQIPKESLARIEAAQVLLMRRAKQSASYWLGLVHFEQKNYLEAIDFLNNRTLKATPNGPWSAGARYNLARAYEAAGKLDTAIEVLESDKDSPQSHGNQLRARWLKEKEASAKPVAK